MPNHIGYFQELARQSRVLVINGGKGGPNRNKVGYEYERRPVIEGSLINSKVYYIT